MKQFADFLAYDPETGLFRWTRSPSSRAPVGSVAGVLNSLGYRQIKHEAYLAAKRELHEGCTL